MTDFSVENIPDIGASVLFTKNFSRVFREQEDISPVQINKIHSYIPWGGDNNLPYDIMEIFDRDETMATCHLFNTELCFGSGISYVADDMKKAKRREIDDFFVDSDMQSYFLGVCSDIKMFAFAVSVLTIDPSGRKIIDLSRREACYCRFAAPDKSGAIPFVYYANWRLGSIPDQIEAIPLLPQKSAMQRLRQLVSEGKRKIAVVHRVPGPDFACYPIPYYAALLRGKWFSIKQLIGAAKEAKLRNSAPIKYHIEIGKSFWDRLLNSEGITDPVKKKDRIEEEKMKMIDFLTGAENSGKVLFSTCYVSPDGKEQHDVVINKIDSDKEGGDWQTDLQEAVNMICFTMRVHSNLVGSVPGKSQSNNSGSDKRELHTITQAAQKPWRDILFNVHRMIISFNGWDPAVPQCPFMQLTTLDQHADAKQVISK